jgi:hypothetical protein
MSKMLPMMMADSRKMMSVPHEQRIFADKITVAHAWDGVKRNRMPACAEELAAKAEVAG